VVKKLTLEHIRGLAEEHGGRLISSTYIGSQVPILFECAEKHQFLLSVSNLKHQGTWCSKCSGSNSLGERACKITLEQLFGKKFNKTRGLDWLRSPISGARLELDMYNKELRLALEFQGRQHRDPLHLWFKDNENLFKQLQERDALKARLATEHGVTLLTIDSGQKIEDLPQRIYSQLVSLGYQVRLLISAEEVDLSEIYLAEGFSDEDLFGFLQGYVDTFGYVPNNAEWAQYACDRGYPSLTSLSRRYGAWSRFVHLAGHEPRKAGMRDQFTKAELISYMQQYVQDFGKFPTRGAWVRYAREMGIPTALTYRRYFKTSWEGVLTVISETIPYILLESQLNGRYTRTELLSHLCKYAQEFGVLPSGKTWRKYSKTNKLPCVTTLKKHLGGSWSSALEQVKKHLPTYIASLEKQSA